MRYVFVSHANIDKPRLKPILQQLLDAGIPLWIDRPNELGLQSHRLVMDGIKPGADFDLEIRTAYEKSCCVLFFLSHASNNPARSDQLFREFDHGITNEKIVLAQIDRIPRAELSGLVRIRQALDLAGNCTSSDAVQKQGDPVEVLVAQLQKLLLSAPDARPEKPLRNTSFRKYTRLLPYLCNRRIQQRRFMKEVQESLDHGLKHPLFFFVVGKDNQCADKFVEQLHLINLPRLLSANNLSGRTEDKLLRWPSDLPKNANEDDIETHVADLELDLKEKLGLKLTPGKALIQRRLDQQNGALFVYFDVDTSKWNPAQKKLLQAWMKWWSTFKLSERRYPVIVVGRFCFPPQGMWARSSNRATTIVLNDLARLRDAAPDDTSATILPQLGDVSFDDVRQWIIENNSLADYDTGILHRRIRGHFTGSLGLGERRIAMSDAARFLADLLDELNIEIDNAALEGFHS